MILYEECLLIVAHNVYVGVSGTTGRVLLFLPVSSQIKWAIHRKFLL